jgi:methyl-accepting chemotaxis protein
MISNDRCIPRSARRKLLALVLSFLAIGVASAAQESTIFRYDGQDFIREKTTLLTEDGKSAANTKLDRNSPAYKQLVKKHAYAGQATIFGQKCDSNYAPLTDASGQLTGALFVAICNK